MVVKSGSARGDKRKKKKFRVMCKIQSEENKDNYKREREIKQKNLSVEQ